MAKIVVRNQQNQPLREIELPDDVFRYPFKEHLVHTVVQAFLAGLRAGTHKTKGRGEVAGSGRKLWRQKGTGRARMGSIRSPLWRKGGTVHGPVPRSYAKDVTVREKKNALKAVLSRKLRDEQLVVLDSLAIEAPRTRNLVSLRQQLGLDGKVLWVDHATNENLWLAARNHPEMKTADSRGVRVYDVLEQTYLVFSEEALSELVEVLRV
jgi:large subunit ribosomal protein L4